MTTKGIRNPLNEHLGRALDRIAQPLRKRCSLLLTTRFSLLCLATLLAVTPGLHGETAKGVAKVKAPAAGPAKADPAPATPGTAATTPPAKGKGQVGASPNKSLSPIPDVNGDYIPCRFTPSELKNLHAPEQALTLSEADAESLKERVTSALLAASESGEVTSYYATVVINNVSDGNFTGLTLSQALAKIVSMMNDPKAQLSARVKTSTATDPIATVSEAVSQWVTASGQIAKFSLPRQRSLTAKVDEIYKSNNSKTLVEAVDDLTTATKDEQFRDFAPLVPRVAQIVASSGPNNNPSSVVDSARQYLNRLARPSDVGCAMSILSYRETRHAYGYIIANEYIAVQVVVRNLNPDQPFVLHDVEFAVNTDPTGTPGRFFSGRDKVIVRALSTAQESFDPRNITITSAQGIGALFSAIAPLVGGTTMVPASGVINGVVVPSLQKGWKDLSVDQLNLLNDTGFSSATNSQTIVPKSLTAMVVTFIPAKQFSQGWWTQPCVDHLYLGSSKGSSWRGTTKLKTYSPDSDDEEVGRAVEVCSAIGNSGWTSGATGGKHRKKEKDPNDQKPDTYLRVPASEPIAITSIKNPDANNSTLLLASPVVSTPSDPILASITRGDGTSEIQELKLDESRKTATVRGTLGDCDNNCGKLTILDETDFFRAAKQVPYKQWTGQALQLFANLSLVVVAGAHTIDQSDLDLSVSQLTCPGTDSAGNVIFAKPLPSSLACTLAGKNLNKAAKLRLRNSKNQADLATVDGTVSVTGDSTTATVTFPTNDLVCLPQETYSVFAVTTAGTETTTGQTLHFVPGPSGPSFTSINPAQMDFSKAPSAAQNLTASGCNLTSVASLQLTAPNGKTASFDNTVKPASAVTATFSIDPSKLTEFGTGATKIPLAVLSNSNDAKPISVDPTLDITGLSNKANAPAPPTLTGTVKTDAPAIADKEFTFTLTGSGFEVKTVQVNIQGTAAGAKAVTLTTAKLTPSAASIRGTAKLAAGEYKITVQNGAGGAASNALTFTVKAATAGAPTKPAGTTPKPKGK